MKNFKQVTLLFLIALIYFSGKVTAQSIPYATFRPVSRLIQNGNYKARVQYINDFGYKSNYTLKVRSEGDKITAIFFDDGFIHDGVNNSGYTYSGGYLKPIFDDYDNMIAVNTLVIVMIGMRQYKYIVTIFLE